MLTRTDHYFEVLINQLKHIFIYYQRLVENTRARKKILQYSQLVPSLLHILLHIT